MRLPFSIVILALVTTHATVAALVGGAEPESNKGYPAIVAPEWDAFFNPPEIRGANGPIAQWAGGDVAGTVDLGGGRVVWVFGDTFVSKIERDQLVRRSQMISNSIALQSLPPDRKPDRSQIRFSWGGLAEDGSPRAWITPGSDPIDTAKSAEPGQGSTGWYWFTGGGARMPSGQMHDRLGLFLFHVDKKQGASGVWAIESIGGALVTIYSTKTDPSRWRCRQHRIPFAWGAEAARQDQRLRETSWGVAVLSQPSQAEANPNMLFIYGVRTNSPLDKQLLLARAATDAAEQFDEWRFYAGPDTWSSDPRDALPIAKNVTSELSIESLEFAGRHRYVMVHSQPPLERRILVRTAEQPQGPWTEPRSVFSAPGVDRDTTYFAYAAKGHACLSQPGELLITYVVNSHDFELAKRDTTIYRPRFVRLPLDALFSREAEADRPR